MLVEKIHNYLSGSDQIVNEEILQAMFNNFTFSVKRQLMEVREMGTKLRGSNPGPCARNMAFTALGLEGAKELDSRAKMTFLFGDIVELVAVGVIKLAGINATDTCLDPEGQLEGVMPVGNGMFIPCHADGKINEQIGVATEPHLLEIKSCSDFAFKREWMRGNIGDRYMLQHQVYLETFALDKGVFFVVNKNTGHFTEVMVDKDPDFIAWARTNYSLASAAEIDALPPRFEDGENYGRKREKDGSIGNSLTWGCRYCARVHQCWPSVEVKANSRGVEMTIQDVDDEPYVTRFARPSGEQIGLEF